MLAAVSVVVLVVIDSCHSAHLSTGFLQQRKPTAPSDLGPSGQTGDTLKLPGPPVVGPGRTGLGLTGGELHPPHALPAGRQGPGMGGLFLSSTLTL